MVTAEIGLRGGVVRDPAKRGEQRQAIITAAARVFARKGYEASTMSDIAREMGVSKGILYYQFASKQELIVATRVRASGSAADELAEIVAEDSPVLERMRRALRALIRTNFDEFHRHVILLPKTVGLDVEHAAQVREVERRYESLLAGLVREGIDEGVFVDADSRLTTFTLIRAAESPTFWYRRGGHLSEAEVLEGLTKQLMRSLLPGSSGDM